MQQQRRRKWIGGIIGAALCLGLGLAAAACNPASQQEQKKPSAGAAAVPVRIEKAADGRGWRLVRDGRPYFIKGAGGNENLELLKQAGGNSIRTWGADNADAVLDRAHSLGLTVTLGIWLGHPEHGFKYDDPKMVAEQMERAKATARRYKDHPALLMWGVGNEMEGIGTPGTDPNAWKAVEDIARAIKEIDPSHPTMTVVSEVSEAKAAAIKKGAPSIDALGVNSYGGLRSLPERLARFGWDRPFVVTEFGPLGPWEVGKTKWGAPVEPTSTEKAKFYADGYRMGIAAAQQEGRCLGSYVFLWGDKFEATPTWFGMFLPGTKERLGTVDVMAEAWNGKPPANRAPEIVRWEGAAATPAEAAPGSRHTVTCIARDPEGDKLTYRWEIRPDQKGPSRPEPEQEKPDALKGGGSSSEPTLTFTAPQAEGGYRLFIYITDGKGGAATANLPFYVQAPRQ